MCVCYISVCVCVSDRAGVCECVMCVCYISVCVCVVSDRAGES